MKKILKRCFVSVLLSIICGFICGKLVYKIYADDSNLEFKNNKIYLIQSGTYSNYEKMRTSTIGYDYVYYEDDGEYKSIIGITKNKKNINKIIDLYNMDVVISEYYLDNSKINERIINYDNELLNSDDQKKIKEIISSMLNIYKNEDLKLIKSY